MQHYSKLTTLAAADLATEVREIIAHRLGLADSAVTPKTTLDDGLVEDSMVVIELVLAIEASFDIDIADEEAERLRSVADVIELVRHKLSRQLASSPHA